MNTDKLTQQFYKKYKTLCSSMKNSLDEIVQKDENVKNEFHKKNITTDDFAQKTFNQIVCIKFLQTKKWFGESENFLDELFDGKYGKYDNFFNDMLEPLFYEAIPIRRPNSYYKRFECKIGCFDRTKLFAPLNHYDWENIDILLPNELFSNNKKGILDTFNEYKFTFKN